MKSKFLLLSVGLIAGFMGVGFERMNQSIQSTRQSSLAGQTLVDLAKAIEKEKNETGEYPDSIAHLKIEESSGEFSDEVLRNTTYFKTKEGYVAFVGRPNVAFIYPNASTQYK